MTLDLAYSYCIGLNETERYLVDQLVSKNREEVYIAGTNFISNLNRKLKIAYIYFMVSVSTTVNLAPCAAAVILPIPTTINIIQPNPLDSINRISKKTPQQTPFIRAKDNKITFTKQEMKLIKNFIDGSMTIEEAVLELRGGDQMTDLVLFIICTCILAWLNQKIEALQPVVPPQINIFGLQQGSYNHNPFNPYNQNQAKSGLSSAAKKIQTLVVNENPVQAQISQFIKNGKLDLRAAFQEVERRASEMGRLDFNCSFERFKALATENGRIHLGSVKEAISVLQGEMAGYYTNARRLYYGQGINGPDFGVIGSGKYTYITHVDIKNPVGSSIQESQNQDTDITEQGISIGNKIVSQTNFWSNMTRVTATFRKQLVSNPPLPVQPRNYLTLVDEFDVPVEEKFTIQKAILNGLKIALKASEIYPNLIFINNKKNI